jgi:hypothetical protein
VPPQPTLDPGHARLERWQVFTAAARILRRPGDRGGPIVLERLIPGWLASPPAPPPVRTVRVAPTAPAAPVAEEPPLRWPNVLLGR